MIDKKCPGIDSRYLKIELKKCPDCGYELEFFSDEIKVRCPSCGKDVLKEEIPSCISWCKYAAECIGKDKWEQIKVYIEQKQQKIDIKERVLVEMRLYFGNNIKKIIHTEKVLRYAEKLLEYEPSADRNVVIVSSILHDIELNYAKQILEKLDIKKDVKDEVIDIISFHHTRDMSKDINFKILYDADNLVNFKDTVNTDDKLKIEQKVEEIFMTESAKKLAKELYL